MNNLSALAELTDDEMEQISAGSEAESQEILEYIRNHDPDGYADIMSGPRDHHWSVLRYLYDHGVPLVSYGPDAKAANRYYLGDKDKPASGRPVSHTELMTLIREKIY